MGLQTMHGVRGIGFAGIISMLLLTVGCTSSTNINFTGPPGTVLFVDGKPHNLPAQIEISRPGGSSGSMRHDVSLVATVQQQELRAKGHIDMFGYPESDADKLAVHTCVLDESQLANIFYGKVLVFKGQTASRQPLYELTLGKN